MDGLSDSKILLPEEEVIFKNKAGYDVKVLGYIGDYKIGVEEIIMPPSIFSGDKGTDIINYKCIFDKDGNSLNKFPLEFIENMGGKWYVFFESTMSEIYEKIKKETKKGKIIEIELEGKRYMKRIGIILSRGTNVYNIETKETIFFPKQGLTKNDLILYGNDGEIYCYAHRIPKKEYKGKYKGGNFSPSDMIIYNFKTGEEINRFDEKKIIDFIPEEGKVIYRRGSSVKILDAFKDKRVEKKEEK